MRLIRFGIICWIILIPLLVEAQNTLFPILGGQRAGTSVFTFLKIGVGARVGGMGNTGVALGDDATSLYWNPAAAAQSPSNNLVVSHTRWPVEIEYSYLGYIHRVTPTIYLGLSAGALYTDPMEITTEYEPYGTGEYFNYGDLYLGLTFSQKMTDRFSYGITLKYVEETLADLSMRDFLMDLGTYYWTGFKTLRFCVSLVNFGPQSRPAGSYLKPLREGDLKKEKYSLFSPPTEFRVGSAISLFDGKLASTLISFQLNHPVDNAENLVLGVEENFFNSLFLRMGAAVNQSERSLSFGAGIYLPLPMVNFRADYSWSDFGLLGEIQKIQVSLYLR